MKLFQLYFVIIMFNIFIFACAPNKPDVTDSDIKRVVDRISAIRFTQSLDQEEGTKLKSESDLFLEACKVFRLDPVKAKEKLKNSNPKLYERLEQKNEE